MRDQTIITAFQKHDEQLKNGHDYAVMVNFTVNTVISLLISKGLITKAELDAAFTPVEEPKEDVNV
jgi:hypothetical protein